MKNSRENISMTLSLKSRKVWAGPPTITIVVPQNTPSGYQECIISFKVFIFGEGVAIIDWISHMNLYI